MISLVLGLGGCAIAVRNTEDLLSQAGFRMIPADTPQRAEHLRTLTAHQLVRLTTDGKSGYVYAIPSTASACMSGPRARTRNTGRSSRSRTRSAPTRRG